MRQEDIDEASCVKERMYSGRDNSRVAINRSLKSALYNALYSVTQLY